MTRRAVLVTGSRHWPREMAERARGILFGLITSSDVVIHGGAPHDRKRPDTVSIDQLADETADQLRCRKRVVRPDYAAFRGRERAAPMARNGTMVEMLDKARAHGWETLCIAIMYQNSRGTTDCRDKAARARHETRTFTDDARSSPPS